ncbi:MAG: SDR family NAD(P)-dependent oxidoreductase [Nitrososphaeraceae archaeon]|nr:SDR family NAD(P)-dependent oxidoreductase [Nitrososphaeraceae archaeon]
MKLANRKSSNKKKFQGKIVLITGSSSGIGRQAAIDFAENGAQTIILASRSKSKLEELERRIGSDFSSEVLVYPIDVSKEADVIRMGREILDRFKYIDILVNNAGFGIYNKVQDQQIEEIKSIIFTNYLGMVYCVKVFLDSMIERRSGHIINVASVAASFGVAGLASYCASKYAMMGFSESLYHELYGSGVGVTVVSPIGVKTKFFNNESFHHRTPNYTGFMLEPKKVSKAILAAANSHRLEIMVPFYVRAGVWFKHTLPYVINPIVGYLFRKQLNKSKNEKK